MDLIESLKNFDWVSSSSFPGRVAKALVKPDDSVIKYMKDDPIYKDIAKAYRGPKKK